MFIDKPMLNWYYKDVKLLAVDLERIWKWFKVLEAIYIEFEIGFNVQNRVNS